MQGEPDKGGQRREREERSRRFAADVISAKNLDRVEEYFADDFVDKSQPYLRRGPDQFRQSLVALYEIFPDAQLSIEEVITDGDTVVTRWTMRGTPADERFEAGPVGQEASMSGVTIIREKEGRAKEMEHYIRFQQDPSRSLV